MSFQVTDLIGSSFRVVTLPIYDQSMSLDWRSIARKSLTDAEIQDAVIRRVPLALLSGYANGVVWFFTSDLDVKVWWTRHRCPSARWMPFTYNGRAGWLMGFAHQGYSVFANYFGADTQRILAKVFADEYDPAAERRFFHGCPIGAPDPRDYLVEDQPLIIDNIGVGYLFSDGGALPLDGCAGLDPLSCVASIIFRRQWHRSDPFWDAPRVA